MSKPTTYMQRFREALSLLCDNAMPPMEMCIQWIKGEDVNGADPLQEWALNHSAAQWAQGIGVIEAAMTLAGQPQEGPEHDSLEDVFPNSQYAPAASIHPAEAARKTIDLIDTHAHALVQRLQASLPADRVVAVREGFLGILLEDAR